jgi:hypothetical protein
MPVDKSQYPHSWQCYTETMPNEFIDVREFRNKNPQDIASIIALLLQNKDKKENENNPDQAKFLQNIRNAAIPQTDSVESLSNYINLLKQDKRNLQEPSYEGEPFVGGTSVNAQPPYKQADPATTMPLAELLMMFLAGKGTGKMFYGGSTTKGLLNLAGSAGGMEAIAPTIVKKAKDIWTKSAEGFAPMAQNPQRPF